MHFRINFLPKLQSTHSKRSATEFNRCFLVTLITSIHALQAECDLIFPVAIFLPCLLQSTHSKRSATFREYSITRAFAVLQSTHSKRSATGALRQLKMANETSIHALQAECDVCFFDYCVSAWLLQSTHSKRSATAVFLKYLISAITSIHALQAECDA